MWNRASYGYSKNAIGSVNSAAQCNSANSVSASVSQRSLCAEYCVGRWEIYAEVAETAVIAGV